MWRWIMTRSCGDTAAGCRSPSTPHRSRSGWATRETPAALPVLPCSPPPAVNRCGPSPRHRTCRQERLQTDREGDRGQTRGTASARYLAVTRWSCGFLPEASGWKCRTDEAPPMVTSWAQSSAGFSKTRRTRRALKGLLRGCLVKDKEEQMGASLFLMTFHHMKTKHHLTILRWHHRAQCRRAAGSSCSWAAYCLCSSLEPTSVTHRERHWPDTAGTSAYDSAGLQSANSDTLLYTTEKKRCIH